MGEGAPFMKPSGAQYERVGKLNLKRTWRQAQKSLLCLHTANSFLVEGRLRSRCFACGGLRELRLVMCLYTIATLGSNEAQSIEVVRKSFGVVCKLVMSGWSRRILDSGSFE